MSEPTYPAHFDASGVALPASACPACGHVMDCTTAMASDARPTVGDLTVCIRCGEFCVFELGMTLRAMSDAEFLDLPLDNRSELNLARWKINQLNAKEGKGK